MDSIILLLFFAALLTVNVVAYHLQKRERLPLFISGLLLMLSSPATGFFTGYLFWAAADPGSTKEGAGIGGAMLGLLTLFNGLLVLMIGVITAVVKRRKKRNEEQIQAISVEENK
ncbi:inner-membrane translocator [Halobacillus sp. B23F22_1]|uniref:inner-membrane translocator n=1 Tax=Halobacillus sp. B23F22_1 TaxID=3459514 RepID=UPI00373EB8EB